MVRVEIAEALSHAETASDLLRASWRRPCLFYSTEFLRWQLSYPSARPSMAAVAHDGDQLVGFAAMIPRRMRIGPRPVEINQVTFVCVHPAYRREGLGGSLYAAILTEVERSGHPFVAFTQARSTSERSLHRNAGALVTEVKELGDYPVHGYLYRPDEPEPSTLDIRRAEEGDDTYVPEIQDLILRSAGEGGVLGVDADLETIGHWRADPRQSVALLALEEGRPVGVAMIVRGQVATLRGIEPVTSVERAFVPRDRPDVIAALARASGEVWFEGPGPEFIALPNVSGFDDGELRRVGVRLTPTRFVGHLGIPRGVDPGPFASAVRTNMAVV